MKKSMVLCAALALVMGTYASAKNLPLPSENGIGTVNGLDVSTVTNQLNTGQRVKQWYSFDVGVGQTFTFSNNNDGIVNVVTSKKSELAGTIISTIGVLDGIDGLPAGTVSQVVGGDVFFINNRGFVLSPNFRFEGNRLGLALNNLNELSLDVNLQGARQKVFMINTNGKAMTIASNGAITGSASFNLEDGADVIANSQNGKNAAFGDVNAGDPDGYQGSAPPIGFSYIVSAYIDETGNPAPILDATGNAVLDPSTGLPVVATTTTTTRNPAQVDAASITTEANETWVQAQYNTNATTTRTVNLPWATMSTIQLNGDNKLTVKNVGTSNNSAVQLTGLNIKTNNLFVNNNAQINVFGTRNTTIGNVSGVQGSTLQTTATFGKLKVNSISGVSTLNAFTNNFVLSKPSLFGTGTISGSQTILTIPQNFSIAKGVTWTGTLNLGSLTNAPGTTPFKITPAKLGL